ncbi:MAG: hypothetical protein ABI858_07360 [Pseudoxanthomonas sp.]
MVAGLAGVVAKGIAALSAQLALRERVCLWSDEAWMRIGPIQMPETPLSPGFWWEMVLPREFESLF